MTAIKWSSALVKIQGYCTRDYRQSRCIDDLEAQEASQQEGLGFRVLLGEVAVTACSQIIRSY